MNLTPHFTLEELIATSQKLPNVPNAAQTAALTELCKNVLEPARIAFNAPIRVNSGFRTPAVNAAIGGAATSQHTKGEAADITSADNAKLFDIIRKNTNFDQLIWEKGTDKSPQWIHVSFRADGKNRGEVLRFDGKKYFKI